MGLVCFSSLFLVFSTVLQKCSETPRRPRASCARCTHSTVQSWWEEWKFWSKPAGQTYTLYRCHENVDHSAGCIYPHGMKNWVPPMEISSRNWLGVIHLKLRWLKQPSVMQCFTYIPLPRVANIRCHLQSCWVVAISIYRFHAIPLCIQIPTCPLYFILGVIRLPVSLLITSPISIQQAK